MKLPDLSALVVAGLSVLRGVYSATVATIALATGLAA